MKLENQVCGLDLAKRLKELGVKQESLFSFKVYYGDWDSDKPVKNGVELLYGDVWNYENKFIGKTEVYSAFTVAELGEMLPHNVQLPFQHGVGKFHWCWSSSEGRHMVDTEANARGKMLIYLLENHLIKL